MASYGCFMSFVKLGYLIPIMKKDEIMSGHYTVFHLFLQKKVSQRGLGNIMATALFKITFLKGFCSDGIEKPYLVNP